MIEPDDDGKFWDGDEPILLKCRICGKELGMFAIFDDGILCADCIKDEYIRLKGINCEQWIPTAERYPELDQDVLVWGDGFYSIAVCAVDGLHMTDNGYMADDITHWMPLPEPPQAAQQ